MVGRLEKCLEWWGHECYLKGLYQAHLVARCKLHYWQNPPLELQRRTPHCRLELNYLAGSSQAIPGLPHRLGGWLRQ